MEQTQQAGLRLADGTAAALAALWGEHLAGDLTVTQFQTLGAQVVADGNATAVRLVDLGVTAEVARQTRRTVRPLGLRPTAVQIDRARLRTALDRIIAAEIDSAVTVDEVAASRAARVTRFGRDEALLTVASATHVAVLARQPSGWVRVTDPDPCVLCAGWADGKVRAPTVRMARHRGCACIAQPIFT